MTSTAVNRPTDPKKRDDDIARKLQLYGIFQAFSTGKVPSNKQIDVALNSVLEHRFLSNPSKNLSTEGQQLIADLRDVIDQAKMLLLTKNQGNLLQDFIWHSEQISGGNAAKPGAPVDKDTAHQHGNEALDGLRTLGTLIISNGEFRKLLSDATIFLRDIAGEAAQSAASRVSPSEDQLSQIDHPAEGNTWHDTPDLSASNLRNQARSQFNKQKPADRQELRDVAGDVTQTAHPGDSRDPRDAGRMAANDAQNDTSSGVDGRAGAQAGVDQLKARASANVPDETKDRARHFQGQARDYMQKKLPQERREQGIYRLKKMIVEIQGHQDYQRAIETLLNLAETYTGHSQNMAQQAGGTVRGARSDDHLRSAEADLRLLIERFANTTSLDDLFDSINTLYRDADRDPELKGWFQQVNRYVRKCLREEGYVLRDEVNDEFNRLYDQGQFLLRERYRDHSHRILDEVKFLAEQFDQDKQNKRFATSMQKLFNDLGTDEQGNATFKPHLVKDLTNVILPDLLENVAYIPLPRIEYSDPKMDAVVENLVVESDNLMPNVFEFGSDNYVRWGRKATTSKLSSKSTLSVSGVQMDLRDVSYYVHKKQGFPSITDKGVVDVFMGGQGFSFKVKMATADAKDRQHFFKIEKIEVDIKNLKIKLKQSKYKLPFTLFKPLLFMVIKPVIQKVLEKQIRDSVTRADALLYSIHEDAQRSARATDPTSPRNFYQRYYQAGQNRMLQGKQKSKKAAEDRTVNVAVTQHDSIFPDIKLPGGISSKATEYRELSAKGDKWESPVFSIGTARESSNVPALPAIQRRSHNMGSGGVRGPNNYGQGDASNFSSQMDQSFGTQQNLALGQGGSGARPNGTIDGAGSGAGAGDSGYGSNTAQSTGPTTSSGTILGASNPVLQGTA